MPSTNDSDAVHWQAQWIGRPDACLMNWQGAVRPAPLFRREFTVDGTVRRASVHVCGLGYYELYLNGEKVGDHVLDPTVTQYDRRARYVTYDAGTHLRQGMNAVGVMLGNGWYNCHTPDVWHFDKAVWRDYPKLLLQLEVTLADGLRLVCGSGPEWLVADGPIRFDGLRNGETYDARRELPGWHAPGFDDSEWQHAAVVPGPGGVLEPQVSPPCKVVETIEPASMREIRSGVAVYDMGQNMAGWVQLRVRGPAGTEVTLRHAERLGEDGDIDQGNIDRFIKEGDCQTDRYILKGDGEEVWEPRFTYHGFQYVQVTGLPEAPTAGHVRGRVVQTAFEQIGSFESSSDVLNRLQQCTLWAYRGNFAGIPTDCPHREKNGWTGDAQLAARTGLLNFDVAAAYRQWLETLADTQRPSGQLPGIAPSAGWGYNWGSGPAWDSALLLIPWYIYLYTGDLSAVQQHYEAMKRYVDFCTCMATGHILSFGLGDWCHVDSTRLAPPALTSTGCYYSHARLLAACADLMQRESDRDRYSGLADGIKDAFNRAFYKGDGIYAGGEHTALACAVYQGLADECERLAVVSKLAAAVEANDCRADFGILGAEYVPRVLAEYGHADLAFRLITQPEYPGWVHWLKQGATTLWESWNGSGSRNHIAFGDISAWMFNYLAGIVPDPSKPGFARVLVRPRPVSGLDWIRASHRSPHGTIRSAWRRAAEGLVLEVELPPGTTGHVLLPTADTGRATANGRALAELAGASVRSEPQGVAVEVEAGCYCFSVET